MAFNKSPNQWLNDWSENGTTISVPLATFDELTAAEADSTSGDIRKVVWAIFEKLFNEYNDAATTDRPANWTSTKSGSYNATTGVMTHIFTNTVYTSVLTQEVVDES